MRYATPWWWRYVHTFDLNLAFSFLFLSPCVNVNPHFIANSVFKWGLPNLECCSLPAHFKIGSPHFKMGHLCWPGFPVMCQKPPLTKNTKNWNGDSMISISKWWSPFWNGWTYIINPHFDMVMTILKWWLINIRHIKMVITILKWMTVYNKSPNQNCNHHFKMVIARWQF